MASWPAAVEYTEPVVARGRRVAKRRDPLRNGVFWIVVVGALLAGLVAVNVAVLQLNVRLDRLSQERAKLRDENAALEARSSSAKGSVQTRALERLGLVQAPNTTYVRLGGK
jgi:cell division protein FtsB